MERLAVQQAPPGNFELLVVDDGSSDGTQKMVAKMARTLPYEVRLIAQAHSGPGAAHNRGAKEARATVIHFLANDMLAIPGAVKAHWEMHQRHPQRHVAVVGDIRQSEELPPTALHRAMDPFKDWHRREKKNLGEFDFWVSNLSMKRAFFLEHGLFWEHPEPAMEDLELGNRLFRRGMKLLYCPEALAYHYHPQTIESVIQRAYVTGRNFHLYEERVPHNKCHKFAKILSPKLEAPEYFRTLLRDMVRLSLFNGVTIPYVVVPIIRKAETNRILEASIPFLEPRVTGYYFRKGVRDGWKRKGKSDETR